MSSCRLFVSVAQLQQTRPPMIKGQCLQDVTHPSQSGLLGMLTGDGVYPKGECQKKSEAINTCRATEAAALQHSWASLEHHRGHLCTLHRLTVSLILISAFVDFFSSSFVLLFAQLFLTHKRKFSEHRHKKRH